MSHLMSYLTALY